VVGLNEGANAHEVTAKNNIQSAITNLALVSAVNIISPFRLVD
jgi:hypothetical protein